MNWQTITSVHDVEAIIERSRTIPCVIFKHSTSCPISSIARKRLEMNWDLDDDRIETYYLDLLRHRDISNQIASEFGIRHESPQMLVIKDGKCVHHSSHLAIQVPALA